MNAKEWIAAFAERLGTEPPSADEWAQLLDLAGEAAHSSERVAARAGVEPARALELAREVTPDG